jgi:hypothetical protein
MFDGRALFGIQVGVWIGRGAIGGVTIDEGRGGGIWHGAATLEMPELYIYPVDVRKCFVGQISTKAVNNRVEKHPLDTAEASKNAGSNNLPIAWASAELPKNQGFTLSSGARFENIIAMSICNICA